MTKKIGLTFLFIALFLTVWIVIAAQNKFVLPNPLDVVFAASKNWSLIYQHASVTFFEMIWSVVLSLSISIPLALLMYSWPQMGGCIQGLFLVLKSLPSFALSPLIVFWVGFGNAAILIPATLMLLFPLTIGLYRGLHSAPQPVVDMFRCWKASAFQIFTQVHIPYALPQFFSGLRIALGLVGTAVLAGEWVGSNEGLGFLLLDAKEGLNLPLAYAALCTIFCFSLLFYTIGICIERGFLKKLRLGSIAQILLAAILFTSCSEKSEKPHTLMLDWMPCPNHIPIIYGKANGCFERRGISLQIRTPGSHDALQEVAAGQISACITHLQRVIRANDQDADLVVIGVLVDTTLNGLLINGERTIGDLNGSSIGVSSKTASKTCQTLFSNVGVIPGSWIYLRSDPLTALISNNVDCIWGVYPNIEQVKLQSLGYPTTYVSVADLGYPKKSYELVIATKRDSMLHKQMKPFQEALQESIDTALENPESAFAVYLNEYPQKMNSESEWERTSWAKTIPLLTQNQEINSKTSDELKIWLQDAGIISK